MNIHTVCVNLLSSCKLILGCSHCRGQGIIMLERKMSRQKTITTSLVSIFLLLLFSVSLLAAGKEATNKVATNDFHEGFEYYALSTPQVTQATQGTVEVVELFWYGCPHCFRFEPTLKRWLKTKPKNVTFVRVPAVFPGWPGAEIHARAYYSAVTLKVVDKVHQALFERIKGQKAVITPAQIKAIFVGAGVSSADFDKVFASEKVNNLIIAGKKLAKGYEARSVPLVIVAGKYKAGADLVDGSFEKLLVLAEFLVKKEMADSAKK